MKNEFMVSLCCKRQGFFAFIALIALSAFSASEIGYTVVKNGSDCRVRISGAVGTVKSGEVVCQYTSLLDIDNALVYSPLSSIIVSASIDRVNHRLKLILNTTGKITINNCDIAEIDFKLSGSETEPLFTVSSATFTDLQGNSLNASINPLVAFYHQSVLSSNKQHNTPAFFLIDGRAIQQKRAQQLRFEMTRGDISMRMLTKR